MKNIETFGNTVAIANPVEIHKWIRYDEQTECMLLKETAPFLKYRGCTKPSIMSTPIKGHNATTSYVPYGIQGWAWVVLGGNEFTRKTNYKTSCGNPLCMNPDHIIEPTETCVSNPKPRKEKRMREYNEVIRLSSNPFFSTAQVAEQMGMDVRQVRDYRNMLLTNLLGDGYRWKDLLYALDVAEGIRYANKSPQQRLTEIFSPNPEKLFENFDK